MLLIVVVIGMGEIRYPNSDLFQGEFSCGLREGKGVYKVVVVVVDIVFVSFVFVITLRCIYKYKFS